MARELQKRQLKILAAVVEEYTKTALPVGSAVLTKKYGFDVSSATLRNDMVALEKRNLLYQPHTSAGRIPTDEGYRYFVENLMADRELSKKQQMLLQKEILQLRAQNTHLMRTTAKLLSTVSGYAAVMINPKTGEKSEFGFTNLLRDADKNNIDDLCKIAETLDYIDEECDLLMNELDTEETQIYIGAENPLTKTNHYSMMVSKYTIDGDEGMVALIGPKNMTYDKNKSLMDYIKKLLGSTGSAGAIILLINLC